ncbi:MAG: DUF6364 family protein [Verrucomicrobiota bacterium]|nr:DUF6364 family protein [Verrucomicrobiota bacterium]
MKEKLTLTIDGKAIARAKAFAKKEKASLSQLVERQFNRWGTAESFADKWQGKFKLPKPDPRDHRMNYLLKKYGYR